ncbi:MAG: hypothetical protein A2089_14615 [Elusimicrobia bacterium GWD2_63_28]|nr:MAG: hypothetical protein A2089_14615 [Elusimicrobia bacterium GWD2_63_28]
MFALLAAALARLPAPLPAADWPMFRGNQERTGYAPEQAAPPFTPGWTFQAGGGILSSPAVYEGKIYFGARDGRLYALDARTGAQVWSFATGGRVDSSPCVSSGTVYAASLDGRLYALDRLTGGLRWSAPLGARSISSPLEYGGKVYAGTGLPEKKLKVFDAVSGAQLGSLQALQPVESAPAAYGGRVYFGANDGWVYALDAATLLPPPGWTPYETGGSFKQNAVAVSGGAVYALPGHDDKKVYALSAATGGELRRSAPVEVRASWQTFTSPVAAGDRLYFAGAIGEANVDYVAYAAGNNYLTAADSGTLVSVWASSPSLGGLSNRGLLSSPALAGEFVFAGTVDGKLLVISSAGVKTDELSLSSAAFSSPAVANGFAYIGDMAGRLSSFRASKAAAISWPAPGAIVRDTVTVRGYISNASMSGYTLEYSSGGSPEVWHNFVSSAASAAVEGGELGAWYSQGLANGLYTLRLSVLEGGSVVPANTALLSVRINSVPQAPAGLAASDVPADTGNKLALSWTSVPGITEYRVYRDAGSGFALLASTSPSPAAYTDAAAATGFTYRYTVRSYDGFLESADSNEAAAASVNDSGDNTPPATVTDLEAVSGERPGSVELTWTATGNDGNIGTASHFLIKYTTSPLVDWAAFDSAALSSSTRLAEGPAGDNISHTISGLSGGVTYYFGLKGADAVPNYAALPAIATTYAAVDPLPPLPPSGLAAVDTPGDEGDSITLSWTLSPDDGGGADDVYGYKVYRRLASGVFGAPVAELPAGTASYDDYLADSNVRYYYAVSAYDSTNESPLSAEADGVAADNFTFFDATDGGSMRLSDGARVEIPGGSASNNDGLLFVRLDPVTYEPLARAAAAAANPTGIAYQIMFRSTETRLNGRAVITLPYTDAEVAGMEAENLRLYTRLADGTWAMLNTSAVDTQARRVRAEVSRFSIFSVMEYVPSGQLFSGDEVYTYPNPATGETVTFKFRVSSKAFVRIDVYNVAGEQVAALERADCPAGQASEITWGIKGVASGVYVYRVKAESASGSKTIVKKLAVIH